MFPFVVTSFVSQSLSLGASAKRRKAKEAKGSGTENNKLTTVEMVSMQKEEDKETKEYTL